MSFIKGRVFIIIVLYFFLVFFRPGLTLAQGKPIPILEREISIKVEDSPVPSILATIADQGNFVFSYNPTLVQSLQPRSMNVQGKPVRHALHILFEDDIRFKERGNYVILKKNETVTKGDSKPPTYVIEGYISEAGTGHKLTETTVYSKKTRQAAITDQYGFFRLEVTSDSIPELNIVKAGFRDTLIAPLTAKSYITLELESQTRQTGVNSLQLKPTGYESSISGWSNRLVKRNVLINTRNISSTFFSVVQLSLAPYISTNKLLTGNTVNNVSINTTIGYIKSVRYFEAGGIFNIVRDDAGFLQVAGVGNVVGNQSNGFQAAGVLNLTRNLKGAQAGGIINIARNDAYFFQAAGVGNITGREFTGLQAAGVFNRTKYGKGVQFSGLFNLNETFHGGQFAGLFNKTINSRGVQAAGLFNRSKEFKGIQISGLFNSTGIMQGTSISVINVIDSCQGIPIGVFNFIKNGYHSIEISTNEMLMLNTAFRSGVDRFYTIINAGIYPGESDKPFWMFGFGAGTRLNAEGKFVYNVDVTKQQVIHGKFATSDNSLTKLYLGVERYIFPKVSIAAGLTYNFFLANTETNTYEANYSDILPYTLTNSTFDNGNNLKTWPGFKFSLRFL